MKSSNLYLSDYRILEISIGIVYLWFGALKYFPGLSPAEELAKNTIDILTFGLIPSGISISLLAIWETLIGVLLIFNIYKRIAIYIAIIHLILTFTPLILFMPLSFTRPPFAFTLLGQYIVKNIAYIAALLVLLKHSPTVQK